MIRKYDIMLVEDEPLITILYEDVLSDAEFRLTHAVTCNRDASRGSWS
jgi:DNA-binding response OmpR family regulator